MPTDPSVARIVRHIDENLESIRDDVLDGDIDILELVAGPAADPLMVVHRGGETIATVQLDPSSNQYEQVHLAGAMFGADRLVYGTAMYIADKPTGPSGKPWTQKTLGRAYRSNDRGGIVEAAVINDADRNKIGITVVPFDRSLDMTVWSGPQRYEYTDTWVRTEADGTTSHRSPPGGAIDPHVPKALRAALTVRPEARQGAIDAAGPAPHPGPVGWFADVMLAHYLFENASMYVILAERGREHIEALNQVGFMLRERMD